MRSLCRFVYCGLALGVLALPAVAVPVPVNCPTTGTYADLIAMNATGGCFVADKLFSNFFHLAVESRIASAPATTEISYQTIPNAPVAVGFEFTFDLNATVFGTANLTLSWLVTGPNITSAHLSMESYRSGATGTAAIGAVHCEGGPVVGCPVADLGALGTINSPLLTSLDDSTTFSPVSQFGVVANLSATAVGPLATAGITSMTYTVDQTPSSDPIPEPATVLVTGLPLLGFALLRRRRVVQ